MALLSAFQFAYSFETEVFVLVEFANFLNCATIGRHKNAILVNL